MSTLEFVWIQDPVEAERMVVEDGWELCLHKKGYKWQNFLLSRPVISRETEASRGICGLDINSKGRAKHIRKITA
jgi:hypothetical protein